MLIGNVQGYNETRSEQHLGFVAKAETSQTNHSCNRRERTCFSWKETLRSYLLFPNLKKKQSQGAVERIILRNVSTLRTVNLYVVLDGETDGHKELLVNCFAEIKRILIVRDGIIKESMAAMAKWFEKRAHPLAIERLITDYMWSAEDIQNLYREVECIFHFFFIFQDFDFQTIREL